MTTPSPLPTDEDARGLLAAIDDISDGLEHYEPTDHARRSVRSLRIVLDAARRSVVSTPDVRALIQRLRNLHGGSAIVQLRDDVIAALEASAVSAPPTITDDSDETEFVCGNCGAGIPDDHIGPKAVTGPVHGETWEGAF